MVDKERKEKQVIDFTPDSTDPSTYKYFPDDPNSEDSLVKSRIKEPSQYYDPCELSARMSRQCLEDHWDDPDKKQKCKQFFEAYKDCKAMWIAERRKR
ncbi:Mitochondrial copper homeostasis protein [Monosporozyma unispora]|nr:Mitochondrial copper homeostasis protein [Kazachstania unispora]